MTDLRSIYSEIRALASRRDALHSDHDSCRPLSPDYELIGLLGEFAFGGFFGLPVDLSIRPSGDGGVDFHLPCGLTVDVKTSRKRPHVLPVEPDKITADIYVQAWCNMDLRYVRLLGWCSADEIRQCPVLTLPGHSIMSHHFPVDDLHPISTLATGSN